MNVILILGVLLLSVVVGGAVSFVFNMFLYGITRYPGYPLR